MQNLQMAAGGYSYVILYMFEQKAIIRTCVRCNYTCLPL